MKTLYDWYPGRRGELLAPKGSTSLQHSIVPMAALGHDVVRELFESGRLTGRALDDARLKYEGRI